MRTNGEFYVMRNEYSITIAQNKQLYLELFLYENITRVNKLCDHKMVDQMIKPKLICLISINAGISTNLYKFRL